MRVPQSVNQANQTKYSIYRYKSHMDTRDRYVSGNVYKGERE